jgi:DNA-directed RNA polymerase specialized sigma24 family protein
VTRRKMKYIHCVQLLYAERNFRVDLHGSACHNLQYLSAHSATNLGVTMEFDSNILLADVDGQPLGEHIQSVLRELLPRFRRTFPYIRDEAQIANILEGAGQRIAAREKQIGPIPELHGYTWVALKNATLSVQRRSEHKVQSASISNLDSDGLLAHLPAREGTQDAIEGSVLLSQALNLLSEDEKMIAIYKQAGFSDREIAQHMNTSTGAVSQTYFRMRYRVRKFLARGRVAQGDRCRATFE